MLRSRSIFCQVGSSGGRGYRVDDVSSFTHGPLAREGLCQGDGGQELRGRGPSAADLEEWGHEGLPQCRSGSGEGRAWESRMPITTYLVSYLDSPAESRTFLKKTKSVGNARFDTRFCLLRSASISALACSVLRKIRPHAWHALSSVCGFNSAMRLVVRVLGAAVYVGEGGEVEALGLLSEAGNLAWRMVSSTGHGSLSGRGTKSTSTQSTTPSGSISAGLRARRFFHLIPLSGTGHRRSRRSSRVRKRLILVSSG
jgi:hypothetical protein